MADSAAPPAGGPQPPAQNEPPKTFTQDDLNALDAKVRREYEAKMADLKDKAGKWDTQQEATKSEIQREKEARAAVEKERDALKLERDADKWRSKFGKKNNIPEADWDRLLGSTEAEIETDAKAWAKSRGLDKAGGPTPPGAAKPGEHAQFNQFVLNSAGRGGR